MCDVGGLGSPRVKGAYHKELLEFLIVKWGEHAFTQDSLAAVTGKEQTTIGKYLNGGDSGAFDLDEADAALRHVGSSLKDFIADPEHAVKTPPLKVSRIEARLSKALRGMDDSQLEIVLGTALSVRRSHRTKTPPKRQRVAGLKQAARNTGEKP